MPKYSQFWETPAGGVRSSLHGKIHEALSGDMLRSISEVIIANLLHERDIPFRYEQPLFGAKKCALKYRL